MKHLHRNRWLSVPELFDRRLRWLANQNRSPNSVRRERCVQKVLLSFWQTHPAPVITSDYLEQFKEYRRDNGITGGGINLELRHLKACCNWGARERYCLPVKVQFLNHAVRRVPRFLEHDEVCRFLQAIDDVYWRMVFKLFLYTGARRQEVASLRWRDIDLQYRIIRLVGDKNDEERQVPLHNDLQRELARFWGRPDDFIIRCQPTWIYRMYRRYLFRSAIYDPLKQGLHTLRHTFATHFLQSGGALTDLKYLLGHKSIQTTMIYAHHSMSHLNGEIDRMDFSGS